MKAKKLIIIISIFTFLICLAGKTIAMSYYETVGTTTGIVTTTALNVRTGPGTNFTPIATVYKNEYVRVFAKIGSWYVIQTNNDFIGVASTKYIRLVYPTQGSQTQGNTSSNTTNNNTTLENGLTAEEQEVFNLVNKERTNAGLKALKVDLELQKVAKEKARDLVNNNYFAHNSPTYGSPFDMMKSFGITYKSAGENLAGNSSGPKAVEAWMNSEGHRANILSSSFNYTGVAVVESPKYGRVYVQMFIGK